MVMATLDYDMLKLMVARKIPRLQVPAWRWLECALQKAGERLTEAETEAPDERDGATYGF